MRITYRRLAMIGLISKLMRRRAEEGNLPAIQQFFENMYLWIRNGITPGYYCAAGLYRKQLSWKQKCEFISDRKFERRLARINNPRYGFVTLNKVVTFGILRMFNIPTPPFLGVINGNGGQTFDGRPFRSASDLIKLVERTGIDHVCFKYVGGWCGTGFHKVRIEPGNDGANVIVDPGGTRMSLTEFWDSTLLGSADDSNLPESHYGILCQGVVDQHPTIAGLHPQSLNTARIWLYQSSPKKWDAFAGILRMGVRDMCVDNSAQGGIFARIDLRTGRLDTATDTTPLRPVFSSHPTTNAQIEGLVLPMWDQVLPISYTAASAFSYQKLLGIDIAFSKSGPLVLELEAQPHAIHQIGFDRGVAPLLDSLSQNDELEQVTNI